jgi:rare lipoprotein A
MQPGAPSNKYYSDDGPPDVPPEQLESTPDAIPRAEPLHRFANRAYVVFGKQYQPRNTLGSFKETGIASWYGKKFHGQKTAIGETYDMFAMSAAHPTAPLPSYMRVTNLENGRSVVVRVNDRGPFLHDRVIDLSYAAAAKLGFARKGSARVEIELVDSATTSVLQPPTVASALAPLPPSEPVRPAPAFNFEPPVLSRADAGVYLQLAAFASDTNATAFVNQVAARVSDAVGVSPHIVSQDGWSRVRLGPFASRDAALATSSTLKQKLGIDGVLSIQQ